MFLQTPLAAPPVHGSVTVRGAGGQPVEGAELRWVPRDEQHFPGRVLEPDLYEVLVRDDLFLTGEPLARTGPDGRATYERNAGHGYLCVRAGDEHGCIESSNLSARSG